MILSSFSVLTRALGFVFRIFLSRLIGAEGLGVYQVAFSVFMVLETFVSSGLPLVVSKKTSALNSDENNKDKESSMVTSALIVGAMIAIIICGVVFVFNKIFGLLFTDERCIKILFILLPSLVFSSVYAVLRGNLWGHKKYFLVSLTEFIEQVVRVILTILFLGVLNFALDKVFLASISYVISCMASSLLVLVLYFKIGGKLTKKSLSSKEMLKTSAPITLVRVLSSLLSPLIAIIVPMKLVSIGYTSSQALSVFGVAMGMTFPLLYIPSTIIGALNMTLIPDLSSSIHIQNYTEVKNKINFSVKFVYFISFIFIALFFSLGVPICEFFYASSEAGRYLIYSALLILPISLSSVTISCLNALDMEVKSFINYMLGAVILLLSILFLTKYLGVLSLVWGMGLCLGLASTLNLIMVGRKLNDAFFNFKYLLLSIVCALPVVLISKWSYSLLFNLLPLFFSLGISCMVGFAFYILLALVFDLCDLSFLKINRKKTSFVKTKNT